MFKPPADQLASATHAGGTMVALRFADGLTATINLKTFKVETARLKLNSTRASWGSAVEIDALDGGEPEHVDAAVLRAHIDPVFAAELRREITEAMAEDMAEVARRKARGRH